MYGMLPCYSRARHVLTTMRNMFKAVLVILIVCKLSNGQMPNPDTHHLRASSSITIEPISHPIITREDTHVQAEIHKIELNSTHYRRTGVRGNPDFMIEYENHPFDLLRRQDETEKLVHENPDLNLRSLSSTLNYNFSIYKPLRITFSTAAMDSQVDSTNSAQITFVKNTILPRMGVFWSSALNVVPVKNNLYIDPNELAARKYCGDSEFSTVPSSHMVGGQGVSDTDLILYVSATASTRFCGSSTLAVALACAFDQYDRPIAGAINFCLNQIDLTSLNDYVIESNIAVATHEAGHVLGMSSNAFRFFRDHKTGLPRTSRPFSYTSQTCWDGNTQTQPFPSNNTLQFAIDADTGDRYARIVTPTVQAVVRNQFGCQSLQGARLEHWPTNPSSCIGDHWDERQFNAELMSPVISAAKNYVSPLTLALLEDSGWYMPNYNASSVSPWGLGAGCDFEDKPCLVQSNGQTTVPSYGLGFFCTKSTQRGCSPDRFYKMACTAFDYANYQSSDNPAPSSNYQYFPSQSTFGGPRLGDYCPTFSSSYKGLQPAGLDCRFSGNSDIINLYGEVYGVSSQCFESNLGEAKCFEAYCLYEDFSLKFYVGSNLYTCQSDFQEIQVSISGISTPMKITCPRLSQACPDMFCPANCAGRGFCNYTATVNGIARPTCECFDKNDTSVGCSDSVTLDSKYRIDPTTLTPKPNTSILEALKLVFTSRPGSWSTASWAWATSLFVLFLLLLLCIVSSCCRCRNRSPKRRGPRSDD